MASASSWSMRMRIRHSGWWNRKLEALEWGPGDPSAAIKVLTCLHTDFSMRKMFTLHLPIMLFLSFSLEDTICSPFNFREKVKEKEKKRKEEKGEGEVWGGGGRRNIDVEEKYLSVASLRRLYWGLNIQLRCMPWPEIESATFYLSDLKVSGELGLIIIVNTFLAWLDVLFIVQNTQTWSIMWTLDVCMSICGSLIGVWFFVCFSMVNTGNFSLEILPLKSSHFQKVWTCQTHSLSWQ